MQEPILIVQKKNKDFEITITDKLKGSTTKIELSENLYEQLRSHFEKEIKDK